MPFCFVFQAANQGAKFKGRVLQISWFKPKTPSVTTEPEEVEAKDEDNAVRHITPVWLAWLHESSLETEVAYRHPDMRKLLEVLVIFTDFTCAFLSSASKFFTAAPNGKSGQASQY